MNRRLYIEKYIQDFEEGNITVEEIALKEGFKEGGVYREIKKYYAGQNKTVPKVLVSIEVLKEYLKRGLSENEIQRIASSKKIIIPKRYFEIAQRELKNEKKGENVKG